MKVGIIVFGVIVLLFLGVHLLLKSYLSSERLKSMILPRAEALTGRKVSLEDIHVSLWKGVVAKGLSVKEIDGQRDFFRMKEFILSYRLLPLLKKEFVIKKIEILSPSVTIIKDRQGKFNFSSILERSEQKPPEPVKPTDQGLPISIIADRLSVQNAQFKFVDEAKELPDCSGLLDMEFVGSLEKDGTPKMKSGQIAIKEIQLVLKEIVVKTTGKIQLDDQVVRANIRTLIGKESIDLTATVKDYLTSPAVNANLYAKELDLDRLMGLGSGKTSPKGTVSKEPAQERGKSAGKAEGSLEKRIKASGEIKVDTAQYQGYTIKNIHVNYTYIDGNLNVAPLALQFSGGDVYKTDGSLNGKVQLASARIRSSLKGDAEIKLGKGVIKDSKIFHAISTLTGLQALKEPVVEEGAFQVNIKEEKIFLDGFIRSTLFRLSPKGFMGFDQKLDVPTELKISPELSKQLSRELAQTKWITDDQGWTILPLKIKGTTEKPDINLDTGRVIKQIVPEITRDIQQRLFQRRKSEK